MSKVRADFDGVIWYVVEGGSPKSLKAGDEIPEGMTLGDHVTEPDETPKPRARRNAKQD